MIGKLEGVCAGVTPESAVLLDVGGVGYVVRTPIAHALSLKEGSRVSLLIQTVVREDALDLYGFSTQEELSFFKMLTSVSGVGPKTALGILNVADVRSLKRSIAAGDAGALTKVFGIGKKSAERIVVELKDKLAGHSSEGPHSGGDADVIEALMALGYRAEESREALKHAGNGEEMKEKLAAALKYLGSHRA